MFDPTALMQGYGELFDVRADRREAEIEAAAPPIGQFVTLDDGRRVHAYVAGTGPDLVLIHGAGGNLRDFTFGLAAALIPHFRVTAFDRPGLGYSDRADPAYDSATNTGSESPREQAQMLQQAAQKLGITRPIVLGQSFGGAVAMAWALEQPDHTGALVVVSGATQPWSGGLGMTYALPSSDMGGAALVPMITSFMTEGQVAQAVEAVFAPHSAPDGYAAYMGASLAIRRRTLRANTRQVMALNDHLTDMVPLYRGLDLPVEIVHGTHDTTVPLEVHAEPLATQVAGAQLTKIEGVGHMPHHTHADSVVDAVHRAAARAGLHPAA